MVNGQVSLVVWLDSCLSCAFCYSKGICRSLVHLSINSNFPCFVHFQFYFFFVFRSRIMLLLARTRRNSMELPKSRSCNNWNIWMRRCTHICPHLIGVILSFSEITFSFCFSFSFVSLLHGILGSAQRRSSSPSHLLLLWCSLHLISFLRILFFPFRSVSASAVCCT